MTNFLGPASALGCSMTWAVGASLYSRLSGQYSVFAVNFTRALFALPLFLVTAALLPGGIASFRVLEAHHLGWFVISMICSYGLGDAFFMWSTRALGAPGALAVSSIYPLWTATIGVIRGEPLSLAQLLGVLITVGGVIVVILNGPRAKDGSERGPARRGSYALGVLMAFATSLFWAGNTFAISHVGRGLDTAVANSVRMAMALFLSAGFGLLLAPKKPLLLPKAEIMRSSGIFVLESFIGSGLFIYGLAHSSLAVGSTLSSLAPVVSVPVALAMGIERFAIARVVGIVTVVCGLILLVAG
jgi:drug/metabolite transporter (DMT)-like permease